MGYGPKGSKIMVVRGVSTSPDPTKYQNPEDINTFGSSMISKSFG